MGIWRDVRVHMELSVLATKPRKQKIEKKEYKYRKR